MQIATSLLDPMYDADNRSNASVFIDIQAERVCTRASLISRINNFSVLSDIISLSFRSGLVPYDLVMFYCISIRFADSC